MTKEKAILKSLNNNNALYEAIYCQVVSVNDFIKEIKVNIKYCLDDIKNGYNVELSKSQLETYNEQLNEYRAKRRLLKKAFKQIFCEDMSEYNA